jgi:hypothetical protein
MVCPQLLIGLSYRCRVQLICLALRQILTESRRFARPNFSGEPFCREQGLLRSRGHGWRFGHFRAPSTFSPVGRQKTARCPGRNFCRP